MEVIFLSLFLPWFLLVIEKFFPYPYLFEELAKLAVVIFILNQEKKNNQSRFSLVLIFSLGFSLSEGILYLNNILAIGDFSLFFIRLIFTGLLHFLTTTVIYFFGRNFSFWGLLFGLLMAMTIHYCYNWLVGVHFL